VCRAAAGLVEGARRGNDREVEAATQLDRQIAQGENARVAIDLRQAGLRLIHPVRARDATLAIGEKRQARRPSRRT
jgi:hypothetical protein